MSLSFPSDTEMMAGSGTKSGISSGNGMRTGLMEKGSDSVDWISFLDFFNTLLTVCFFTISLFYSFFFFFFYNYSFTHVSHFLFLFFIFFLLSTLDESEKYIFIFFSNFFLFSISCLLCYLLILIFLENQCRCCQ